VDSIEVSKTVTQKRRQLSSLSQVK